MVQNVQDTRRCARLATQPSKFFSVQSSSDNFTFHELKNQYPDLEAIKDLNQN